jgi:hypothetical protein
VGLPPDLARLGNDLVDAARRTTTARRARRRRFVTAAVGGALAFAALTPAALDPAHRDVTFAATGTLTSAGCDVSRGARTSLVRCEGPMVLHRPYAIN